MQWRQQLRLSKQLPKLRATSAGSSSAHQRCEGETMLLLLGYSLWPAALVTLHAIGQ